MRQHNDLFKLLEQEQTLGEMIENRASKMPDAIALIFHDQTMTYREFNEKTDRLATALLKMGLTDDDRIAVILPTRPEFLMLWLAASKIGATVVGLNIRYREEEIIYMVKNAKPSTLVCINEITGTNYDDFFKPILSQLPSLKKFIFLGKTNFDGAVDFEELLKQEADQIALNESAKKVSDTKDNFIIYTSGTTGKPKGAVLTQKSIMAMIRPCGSKHGAERRQQVALRPATEPCRRRDHPCAVDARLWSNTCHA